MDNTVFVYGIAAVIMLMVGSLVGMALVKPNRSDPTPAPVPIEIKK
jgi:hypothetical protein